jgi:hypothetical protein
MSNINSPNPTEYFPTIYYNSQFYESNQFVTYDYADNNYLSRVNIASSVANPTTFSYSTIFNGGIIVNSGINSDYVNIAGSNILDIGMTLSGDTYYLKTYTQSLSGYIWNYYFINGYNNFLNNNLAISLSGPVYYLETYTQSLSGYIWNYYFINGYNNFLNNNLAISLSGPVYYLETYTQSLSGYLWNYYFINGLGNNNNDKLAISLSGPVYYLETYTQSLSGYVWNYYFLNGLGNNNNDKLAISLSGPTYYLKQYTQSLSGYVWNYYFINGYNNFLNDNLALSVSGLTYNYYFLNGLGNNNNDKLAISLSGPTYYLKQYTQSLSGYVWNYYFLNGLGNNNNDKLAISLSGPTYYLKQYTQSLSGYLWNYYFLNGLGINNIINGITSVYNVNVTDSGNYNNSCYFPFFKSTGLYPLSGTTPLSTKLYSDVNLYYTPSTSSLYCPNFLGNSTTTTSPFITGTTNRGNFNQYIPIINNSNASNYSGLKTIDTFYINSFLGMLYTPSYTSTNDIKINTLTIGKGNSNNVDSTALGNGVLLNDTGNSNTGVGYLCLNSNITGNYSTSVGAYSNYQATEGNYNCSVGYFSMLANKKGYNNACCGAESLLYYQYGYNNTSIGAFSGNNGNFINGYNNIFIGYNAGSDAVTDICNTIFLGNTSTLKTNIYGGVNMSVLSTLQDIYINNLRFGNGIGPNSNIYIGNNNTNNNNSGNNNIFIGNSAGTYNTTGNNNLYIGQNAGGLISVNTTGSYNIFIGYKAGYSYPSTVSNSCFIGYAPNLTNTYLYGDINLNRNITLQNGTTYITPSVTQLGYSKLIYCTSTFDVAVIGYKNLTTIFSNFGNNVGTYIISGQLIMYGYGSDSADAYYIGLSTSNTGFIDLNSNAIPSQSTPYEPYISNYNLPYKLVYIGNSHSNDVLFFNYTHIITVNDGSTLNIPVYLGVVGPTSTTNTRYFTFNYQITKIA